MRDFLQGKIKLDNSDINKYFTNSNSILWNREYGSEEPRCDKFDKISKMLNVGHMIIGHTIQDKILVIIQYRSGKLFFLIIFDI